MKITVGKSIVAANDRQAEDIRRGLRERRFLSVNILASPGAGKTSLISRLLTGLPATLAKGVIEGDVAGRVDADKIAAMGFAVTQINTDGGCHLSAAMIERALAALRLPIGPGVLFIENIGNLICPASFDLGEMLRVVVASTPEGDDKPIKYPGIFGTADAVVLNKTDLADQVEFDMKRFVDGVRAVNGACPIFNVSCRRNEGLLPLLAFLEQRIPA